MPAIEERAAQPYVAVRRQITIETFPDIADRLPELFNWLAARGIEPAGPPFFKYNLVVMPELEIEAGVPVAEPVPVNGEGEMFAAVLPAGRYATMVHIGHPSTLVEATRQLLDWAAAEGLEWDNEGARWGARLELLHTDPSVQPDMNQWETKLAFRLRD